MHHYSTKDYVDSLHASLRELEGKLASAELGLDVAWDEIERGRDRERRLLWTAISLGVVAVVAIVKVSWLAIER